MPYWYFPERVPYTNFHDLNLDWLLREVKQTQEILDQAVKDIGAVAGSSLPDLNNQTKALRDRADALEQRASALEQRADATDAEIADIKADATSIHTDISGINSQIAEIINKHNALDTRVQYLENHPYILPQMSTTVLGGAKADPVTADDIIPVHIDAVTAKLFVPVQSVNIPQATENNLGGIKARAKTNETIEVKIDPATGFLYTQSGAYDLPQATESALGGIKAPVKTASHVKGVAIDTATGLLYSEYPEQASASKLGLIIADPKTDHDTLPVHIAPDGKLYVEPQSVYQLPIASNTNLGGVIAAPKTEHDHTPIVNDAQGRLYVNHTELKKHFLPKQGGEMAGDIGMNSHYVKEVPEPLQDDHAANKAYVDSKVPGMATQDQLGLVRVQGISDEAMPVEIAIGTNGQIKGSLMTAYNSPTGIGGVAKEIKKAEQVLPVGMDSDGKQYALNPIVHSSSSGSITAWAPGSVHYGYLYSADIAAPGVKATDFPLVVWRPDTLDEGHVAPVCAAGDNVITVYSNANVVCHWLSWIAFEGRDTIWSA